MHITRGEVRTYLYEERTIFGRVGKYCGHATTEPGTIAIARWL